MKGKASYVPACQQSVDRTLLCPGRGGVGGRVQGQKERREEGRTGRVRSEVATDRFGSLKSLQFSWKAAARGQRRMWRGEGFQIQSAHQPKSGRERTGSQSREAERARNHNTENLDITEVLIFFYPSFSDVMSRLSRTMESGPEPGRH
ncbi:unnamed protein product [Pleuronectes platessa]|uniref:Uncharacterized protein n=1 Tax=Pleuronectes platessa TaxID=8262 RepID=A0A9N7Y6I6_PLEPL|nr:unnamed protein product [Pleuronectes platessa]